MPPLIKQMIQISIIDDSSPEKCDTNCGEDWSSPEAIALARQQIKDRFGNKIKLQYLDLSKATANHAVLERRQEIKNKNLSLPLLLINDKLRIAGQFDIRQLLDAIAAEMEIGAKW